MNKIPPQKGAKSQGGGSLGALEHRYGSSKNRTLVPINTMRIELEYPIFFKELNSEIKTIPFKTATPKSAMNPTPAEILNGMPLIHKAKTPPIAENGIAEKISKQCLILLNAKNNITKINNKATGTAICNLLTACSKFSN